MENQADPIRMTAIVPFFTEGGRVSRNDFAALCEDGSVLESRKRTGAAKVIEVRDRQAGTLIIKAWHPKRRITSARLYPYDLRFRHNAAKLRALGFNAPLVRGWGGIGSGSTRFICYEALPGASLRSLIPRVDLRGAAGFISRLHDAGVDFRSLHMGNILLSGSANYGLIDLTDCRFSSRPLSLKRRIDRLIYLCTHKREIGFMSADDRWSTFLDAYCEAAGTEPTELIQHAGRHAGWASLSHAGS